MMEKKACYIPRSRWNHYDDLIYCLGTDRDLKGFSDGKRKISDRTRNMLLFLESLGLAERKEITELVPAFDPSTFFDAIFSKGTKPATPPKQVEKVTEIVSLTEIGNFYFNEKFVKNNEDVAREVLGEQLKKHPAVLLICQFLYGSKDISRKNILNLLLSRGFPVTTNQPGQLNSFLLLLSTCKIVTFNPNRDRVTINWHPSTTLEPPQYKFTSPGTPFTNIKHLRDILGYLKGKAYWIDKHFHPKAFDPISESLDANRLTDLIIFSSGGHCTEGAKQNYVRLKQELANKGIKLEWRLIDDALLRKLHDRWIFNGATAYNVPPVNSIFKGQEAEFIKTSNRPDIMIYLNNSVLVA